jgi:hypothetical protein
MRVYSGKFSSYLSINKTLKKLHLPDNIIDKIEEWIPSFVYTYLNRSRTIRVNNITGSDTCSLYTTLAHIITPCLIQFKTRSISYPQIDLNDIPINLQNELSASDKWLYILDEMIFAFNSFLSNWEDVYLTPEDLNKEKWLAEKRRINNGLRLFAKYYEHLFY